MTRPASERTRAEWANRVRAEYRSAAQTAQVVQWQIACGLPREVIDVGLRVVRDELDHAGLCHHVLESLGGDAEPIPLDLGALGLKLGESGPLAALTVATLRLFCLGETFAVPLFEAMRRGATHPPARQALDRILRDEAVHRAYGWQGLDALLAVDPDGVRGLVAQAFPGALEGFTLAYGQAPDGPPLTAAERGAGLLPGAAYREIYARTVDAVILPRLHKRGIRP